MSDVEIDPERPLIDTVGRSVKEGLKLLSKVGLNAFMFRSKGTLIIRRRGRFYKVLRTRHLRDNWWTFRCKDLDTKRDASFDYQVLGMWKVLDKASTMKDPKDILLIDLDKQGKWTIRTRQELEQYLKRLEKEKKQRN